MLKDGGGNSEPGSGPDSAHHLNHACRWGASPEGTGRERKLIVVQFCHDLVLNDPGNTCAGYGEYPFQKAE